MLRVLLTQNGTLATYAIEGELALESVEQFETATAEVAPGVHAINLDCSNLTFIDSTGVNALLQTALRWKGNALKVQVTHLRDDLREMLDVLGFFEVLSSSL